MTPVILSALTAAVRIGRDRWQRRSETEEAIMGSEDRAIAMAVAAEFARQAKANPGLIVKEVA